MTIIIIETVCFVQNFERSLVDWLECVCVCFHGSMPFFLSVISFHLDINYVSSIYIFIYFSLESFFWFVDVVISMLKLIFS